MDSLFRCGNKSLVYTESEGHTAVFTSKSEAPKKIPKMG